MKLEVFSIDKKKVGDVDLADAVFAAGVNKALFYEVVKNQLANRRRGTHNTLNKGEVRGGGKKPWKQKHTGNARTGSTRNPNWVGGGVAHGPHPRDYSYVLPRKVRRGALRSALSLRVNEKSFTVLDSFKVEKAKTKTVTAVLKTFGHDSALFVDVENDNLMLSVRNLATAKYLPTVGLNVYDILRYKHLFVTKEAALKLAEGLAHD